MSSAASSSAGPPGAQGREIVGGAVHSSVSVVVSAIVGLLLSVVVARGLDSVRYGEYAYLILVAQTGVLLATLGLPAAAMRYIAELHAAGKAGLAWKVAAGTLKASLGVGVLLWALFLLEESGPGMLAAGPYAPAVAAAGLAYLASTVCLSVLQGYRLFRAAALLNTCTLPVQLLLVWAALRAGGGVMAVLTALAVSQLLLAALAAGRILRIERPGTDAPAPWRRILGYAAAVGGVMICDAIVWQRSEIFFLKFYASPQETGYYNVAFSLSSQLVKLVPLGLLSVLTPLFAAYHGTRDSMRLERLFAGSTRVLCYVTFPLVAALSALGVPLVRFVYGEAYSQAASVLWILALSSAIGAIAGAGAGLLLGMERQRVILRVGVFVAVLNLALDLLLIKPYGLRGAALANALSQITAALVGLGYVFVVVRPAFPARPIVKCLGAALAAGAAMALLDRWAPAWAALAAGLALYALCLSRSRAFLSEERDALLHLASMAPARVSPLLRRAFTLLLGSGPARG